MSPLAIGILAAALQALSLWVLTGIRDDAREDRRTLAALILRVGEHDAFITTLKAQQITGGLHG